MEGMKITQEPKFQPITITLETKEEAESFCDMVTSVVPVTRTQATENMVGDISRWFGVFAEMGK
jgi:hypothetical protein